jgi:LysR family nod box-dependent transcriptional activator
MVLTSRGESLIKPVRNVLQQIQSMIDEPATFDPSLSTRSFSFILSDYTATVFTPHLVREMHARAPLMTSEFTAPPEMPAEALDRGEVDFLLLPENLLSEDHPRCSVFGDDFVCVAWDRNTLLDQEISIEQYTRLGHVVARFSTQRIPSIDVWLTKHQKLERRVEVISSAFNTVPHYIVGTNRIATMHRRLALQWKSYLPIKILPVPVDLPTITWGLQWPSHRNHDAGTLWLRDLVLELGKSL